MPSFSGVKLVSVKALTRDQYTVVFREDSAVCSKKGGTNLTATLSGNLYVLNFPDRRHRIKVSEANSVLETSIKDQLDTHQISGQFDLEESSAELMHRRLAHTNYTDIQRLRKHVKGVLNGCRKKTAGDRACRGCLAGHMKQTFSKQSSTRSTTPGYRLHFDITGRRVKSVYGNQYYLVGIDDATRATKLLVLRDKSTTELFPTIS